MKENTNLRSEGKPKWPDWPVYNEKFKDNLKAVLDSNRWAISGYWTGSECMEQKFARSFAEYNNVPYAVPTTNGSSALLVSLEALNVGYGDEVIVPALTWLATGTAVLNVNAKPVLVDVDPGTYCIDPAEVEKAITDRTKAIIVVHLYGSLADMDAIMKIAEKYNLKVIEDCAQSHGSVWRGQRVGSIGDVGAYSMQQGKVLSTGEGGITITKHQDVFNNLQQLRSDSRVFSKEKVFGDMELVVKGDIQGSNHSLSEFQASIALIQLEELDKQNKIREENARYLDSQLSKIEGLQPMFRPEQVDSQTYYGYVVKFKKGFYPGMSGDEKAEYLGKLLGLGTFYLHPPHLPIHKNPLFCPWTKKRYAAIEQMDETFWRSQSFPVAESSQDESVVFHHSILLSERELIDMIVEAFKTMAREKAAGEVK